jgi:hypothetical protein
MSASEKSFRKLEKGWSGSQEELKRILPTIERTTEVLALVPTRIKAFDRALRGTAACILFEICPSEGKTKFQTRIAVALALPSKELMDRVSFQCGGRRTHTSGLFA